MRLALLPLALLLVACPEEGEDLPDITFDPPVDEFGRGEVDLGTVERGQQTQGRVTVTNNTDGQIAIAVQCNFDAEAGFIISCPTSAVLLAPYAEDAEGNPTAGTYSVGPLFQGTAEGDYGGSLVFEYDNNLYTFLFDVEVVPPAR